MSANTPEQLARLWTRTQPAVAAYVSSLLPDFHQAEDVLQEVAVTLVQRFDDYDPQQPFLPWALGVARNKVLASRRTFSVDRHVFDEELTERLASVCEEMSGELDSRREALRKCVEQIHGHARQALELRYADGLKPAEAAKHLGLSDSNVRVMLHRARTLLRECIERRLATVTGS